MTRLRLGRTALGMTGPRRGGGPRATGHGARAGGRAGGAAAAAARRGSGGRAPAAAAAAVVTALMHRHRRRRTRGAERRGEPRARPLRPRGLASRSAGDGGPSA